MSKRKPPASKARMYPTTDWLLGDWIEAAGGVTAKRIADFASSLSINGNSHLWSDTKIGEWKKSRPEAIADRNDALAMIAALRHFARNNRLPLFDDVHVREHAHIFLNSGACRQDFADPTGEDWHQMLRERPPKGLNADYGPSWEQWARYHRQPDEFDPAAIRSRIPHHLPLEDGWFGREQELMNVTQAFKCHPIVVIDGIAGEGKTALAWHAANAAHQAERFSAFDWTSDKRMVIDVDGRAHTVGTETHDDFFEKVLNNMVDTFRWTDLLGVVGDKQFARCADRLKGGRYLIIVDNLESVPNAEAVVERLVALLTTRRGTIDNGSRAIVTSRTQVRHSRCARIDLEGINPDACARFIRYLAGSLSLKKPLSEAQCSRLIGVTGGNPFFVDMALTRLALDEGGFDDIVDSIKGGHANVFPTLFGPLLDALSPQARHLAVIAAQISAVGDGWIDRETVAACWSTKGLERADSPHFSEALLQLLKHRVINEAAIGRYTMHPLIRAYLVRPHP